MNEDLAVDILSRLPTPDLYRCNCVSKEWRRRLVPLALAQRPSLVVSEKPLLNILSRLPTPDLRRCKCVCKDWRRRLVPWALSLRPVLAFAHIKKKGVRVPRFLSVSDDGSLRDEPFPSPSFYAIFEAPLITKAQVLAACNGMVLCCTGYPPRRPRLRAPQPRHPPNIDHRPSSRHALQQLVQFSGVRSPCLLPPLHGYYHGLLGSSQHFHLLFQER